jgi:hypothetical protein
MLNTRGKRIAVVALAVAAVAAGPIITTWAAPGPQENKQREVQPPDIPAVMNVVGRDGRVVLGRDGKPLTVDVQKLLDPNADPAQDAAHQVAGAGTAPSGDTPTQQSGGHFAEDDR